MDLVNIDPDVASPVVAVIGGGAAGALTAAAFAGAATRAGQAATVLVLDPRSTVGPGAAYSTAHSCHLLNVPAGRLGADPAAPDGFVCWLRGNGHPDVGLADFVPRAWFGDYLTATWAQSVGGADPSADHPTGDAGMLRTRHVRDRAVGLRRRADRIELDLAGGATHTVDAAVLAVGNLGARLDWVPAALGASDRFVADPWAAGGLDGVGDARSVLLVGTGLTMVDVALALAGPGRVVTAVSRTGRLPRAHRRTPVPSVSPPARLESCADLPALRAELLAHLLGCGRERGDWRPALDGLRPVTARLWQRLTVEERAHAIREHGSWWNRHRHRVAPQVAEALRRTVAAGRLRIGRGEVAEVEPAGAGLRVVLTDGRVVFTDAVVNCTGRDPDLRRSGDPLIRSLLDGGTARPGPLGLGLDTDLDGGVLDRDGVPVPGLFTLGATRVGQLWESTAIPEIREQAAALGGHLAGHLTSLPVRPREPEPTALT
ncbi:MAG TPA: FAD/NAD(P)-binding protein [Pseudonocardia sp.]|nr:FAD/NAD(P)-binding protein [Pseudonocardia sp.]